jgi:iron complex transport system ATP-binding protein
MSKLVAENLTLRIGGKMLVDDASFRLHPGELVVVLGPNGAGKTSLARASIGLARPSAGQATLDGRDTCTLSPTERARQVAYLPQQRPLAWPSSVRDVVALGRFSYGVTPGRLDAVNARAVEQAIVDCDLTLLAGRRTDTLSGGELARVHCARAFATGAPLLIADEPTAALDPRQQLRILDLVRRFVAQGGGALVVLHDIALAARYATRLLWMCGGKIVADGPTGDTLTAERIASVYGVQARILADGVILDGPLPG